jgi:hypothetical protein
MSRVAPAPLAPGTAYDDADDHGFDLLRSSGAGAVDDDYAVGDASMDEKSIFEMLK